MTNTSYLQRIVARMGTPAAGVGPLFTPPEAPVPAIFDPFAAAEPIDAEIAPPVEPQAAVLPQPQPSPEIVERSELLPRGETVERVIHEFQESSSGQTIVPLEVPPPTMDLPLPQPAPVLEPERLGAPPIETTERETVQQIRYEFVEAAEGALPNLERPIDPAPQPVLEPEIEERIRYEFIEPPGEAPPVSMVEPPIEAEASAAAPVFESPAPQITIGDIVVEIVTRPEAPGRASPPPPRAAQPAEPPASLRAGVRSKRGYGIGQM